MNESVLQNYKFLDVDFAAPDAAHPASRTWKAPTKGGLAGGKLIFGDITGLTGILYVSFDGTNYVTRACTDDLGTEHARGATITVIDGMELTFECAGVTHVRFTTAAGSGPVKFVSLFAQGWTQLGGSPSVTSTPPAITAYRVIADGTDELLISSTARKLWGGKVFNLTAAPVYVKFYDKATAPAETDTPVFSIECPANATASLGAEDSRSIPNGYIALTNGLGVRIVSGIANNDDTAVAASSVLVHGFWST